MTYSVQQPSKEDRRIAKGASLSLQASIAKLKDKSVEIEIEETGEKIEIPLSALKLLGDVLEHMKQGKPFSLVPVAAEMTTQAAAEYLNCSRPHVVKLLENDKIPFTKVGRHRRIKMVDLKVFKEQLKATSKSKLIEMMKDAEDMNLYD